MKTLKIKLTEFDEKILKHELLIEVEEWLQDALTGLIQGTRTRLIKEAQERLFKDEEIETIPATTEGLIQTYFDRSYYKDRKERSKNRELP